MTTDVQQMCLATRRWLLATTIVAGLTGCSCSDGVAGAATDAGRERDGGRERDAGGARPDGGDAGLEKPGASLPAPVRYWSFDECAPVVVDHSGRGGHATATGEFECVEGRIGLAGSFAEAGGRVEAEHRPDLHATGALTVAAWVGPSVTPALQTIVAKGSGASAAWSLGIEDGEFVFTVTFPLTFPDGGAGQSASVSAGFVGDVWTHLGATFDGASLTLYRDGIAAARRTAPGLVMHTEAPVAIGESFAGLIDEVQIWNAVLGPDAVAVLAGRSSNDADEDGAYDDVDNCPALANGAQDDADGDGIGDACDACPEDPENDRDGDGSCADEPCAASCRRFVSCVERGGAAADCAVPCAPGGTPCETAEMAAARHAQVADRRAGRPVIAHAGSREFAQADTLEAFRATFELGADGNEMDIPATIDGLRVCFHDDTLDGAFEAYGEPQAYTWEEVRRLRFRYPGPFGGFARVPSLVEVFDLHRRYGGLIILDGRKPDGAGEIAGLLDATDMWDHVVGAWGEHVVEVSGDPRYEEIGLLNLLDNYADINPDVIDWAVGTDFPMFFVDDPRGVLVALGRSLGAVSDEPYRYVSVEPAPGSAPPEDELREILLDAPDWDVVYWDEVEANSAAQRILARAIAAQRLRWAGYDSEETLAALDLRIVERSIHQDWRYMGLDAFEAILAFVPRDDPAAVDRAREVLWRDDPALDNISDWLAANDPENPFVTLPRAMLDFRIKWWATTAALVGHPQASATEALARDFLALTDGELWSLGFFSSIPALGVGPAVGVLLSVSPTFETAVEMLQDPRTRLTAVRYLLRRADAGEEWALDALTEEAPYALDWVVP